MKLLKILYEDKKKKNFISLVYKRVIKVKIIPKSFFFPTDLLYWWQQKLSFINLYHFPFGGGGGSKFPSWNEPRNRKLFTNILLAWSFSFVIIFLWIVPQISNLSFIEHLLKEAQCWNVPPRPLHLVCMNLVTWLRQGRA